MGVEVLVVGAGPTGLTLAVELVRRGISVRVVEKAVTPPADQSRALAVQARTLELFSLTGLASQIQAHGLNTPSVGLIGSNGRVSRVSFSTLKELDTPFPELRMTPQAQTEALLAAQLASLGVQPERGVELTAMIPSPDRVQCTLSRGDGSSETVDVAYVAGCDGSHSFVRRALGIEFEGETYDDQCLLGEVILDWELPDGELYICPTTHGGIAAAFPVPGEHRFRVIMLMPKADGPLPAQTELSLEEFEGQLRKLYPIPVKVSKPIWLSRYRLHHRVAQALRSGRCFLLGDAAHIHSPAGGQGMNTGIQDAFNLGWKLADVLRGRAPEWVLGSFQDERLPVARTLVHTTDRMFGVAAGHGVLGATARFVAPRLLARLFQLSALQRRMTSFVSQLHIRYRHSPLTMAHGGPFRDGPPPGNRALESALSSMDRPTSVYGLMARTPRHTLLLFAGKEPRAIAAFEAARLAVDAQWSDRLQTYLVVGPGAPVGVAPGVLVDPDGTAHARYGAEGPAAHLLRPDAYIGFRAHAPTLEVLNTELSRRFVP